MLRELGHTGPIDLIGEESLPPYQRPPLSKAYLKGLADTDTLQLRASRFYDDSTVSLKLRTRATEIDRAGKRVTLDDGGVLPYDVLILATGSQARRLSVPGAALKGLLELRGVEDAERLKAALQPGRRLVVIGGGYVGLEVAASARALGLEVVVLERESRVLARVASEPLARFFEAHHRSQGVEIVTGASLGALEGEDGRVRSVLLEDGRRFDCDAVLVGVGALPCDGLARAAGLACENGIVVDESARTSDPSIYAVGDVTWRPLPLSGGRMFRLESVPNALEQARQVAHAILGQMAPAPEVPWFWSTQYEIKLQIAGLIFDGDELLIRGSVEQGKFAVFHLKADRVAAVEAVNSPLDFLAGKQLIASARPVDKSRLADPTVKVKDLA